MSTKCCAFTTLIIFLCLQTPLGRDLKCTEHVNWHLGSCPDGNYWACWNKELDRNRTCSVTKLNEYPYRAWENYVQVQVSGLVSLIGVRPECFCCRLDDCPYPKIGKIMDSSPVNLISSGKQSACSMILDCVLCLLASCYYVDTGTGTSSDWRCIQSLAGLSSVKFTVGGRSSKICPDATTSSFITTATNSNEIAVNMEPTNSTGFGFGLVLLICLVTLAFAGLVAFLWFRASRNVRESLHNDSDLTEVHVLQNGNDNSGEFSEHENLEMNSLNGHPEAIQTSSRPTGHTRSGKLFRRTDLHKSK